MCLMMTESTNVSGDILFPFSWMYVQLSLLCGLGLVCRFSVYICAISFEIMHMCSYICMCPCLSQSLSPWSPLASWPWDSTAVLTLTSTYAVRKGQILAKEERRRGKEVSFSGGGGWGREQSCREHEGVALRQDNEWNRKSSKRLW